ncbi:MAG TPA: molybdopterin molybdotransferase MoeA, partial [Alphaproteobacteria bacterium]|nr:molybdopterin molybdotransferase MoeA [Alphaproteobacteria bacterium]
MISYEEALGLVRAAGAARPLGVETLGLADILGRVCAEDIAAPRLNQPFDNAAMDGFALRAVDLAGAAEDAPVALSMVGHVAAGDPTVFAPPLAGQCYEIMTGAVMPSGCDAVVPVEKTARDGTGRVVFRAPAGLGDNLRRAGEDFALGDPVVGRGTIFNPGHVLALATLGIGTARGLKAPRVAVISTGREVVDRPGEALAPGQIYNSTGPYLQAALGALGAGVTTGPVVPDDSRLFARTLSEAVESGADIVVS